MTNKFLFRAKSVVTKSWVYGNFHYVGDDCFMIGFDDVDHCFMSSELRSKNKIFQRVYRIYRSTLGAYSGLTTNSSHPMFVDIERVFEGDVIVLDDGKTEFTIRFDDFEWRGIGNDGDQYGAYTISLSHLNRKKEFRIVRNIY